MTTLAVPEPAPPPQFQVITLTGRLTSDVQTRSGSNGTEVARLRLAVQRPRGKDGEDKGADFIDVAVFGHAAQVCGQYLTKGRKVAIEGYLHHSEWDSPDGRRQKLEVHARNVEFLDRGKTNEPDQSAEPAESAEAEGVAAA
ncbi:MAG: single-stranded DNA-binding protein [Steroidobacteraceae bacterium]